MSDQSHNRCQPVSRDPAVVAAVQEALMRHPFWKPGLGSSGLAFGLANTAIDAYTKAVREAQCGVQSECEPSRAAMMAAVELEILSCLGRVHTVKIGRLLQKIIDASLVWLPIDTAPLDADVLLGWWREWPERRWECASGLAGSTKGGWLHGQATHWQPLPAAPSLSSAEPPSNVMEAAEKAAEAAEGWSDAKKDYAARALPSAHRGGQ